MSFTIAIAAIATVAPCALTQLCRIYAWSQPGIHNLFEEIVLDGIFEIKGMASFSDVLNEQQVKQIHSYVIHRTAEDYQLQRQAREQSDDLDYRGGI